MRKGIFDELQWRGLIADSTEGLLMSSADEEITPYAGFDPTRSSLHVGHLLPIMTMARFQRFGHRVIAIAGGATGMVGDPSGRSEERKLLSADEIERNVTGIKQQLTGILDFESANNPALLLNNADWLAEFRFLDFLRDVGKHFSVNVMLRKESVQSRLDRADGLSFTEFSYMLLQAYDFLYLHQNYGCNLQIGGTDQWGNIIAGLELIRKVTQGNAHGLVLPLVTKADGTKFGKSTGDAVWLSAELTSPYQFYQFWLNTDDRDVIGFLKRFTWLDRQEIGVLEDSLARHPEQRDAQQALAREVTRMVHGNTALSHAEKATELLFGGKIREVSAAVVREVFAGSEVTEIARAELEGEGMPLVSLLTCSSLVGSKGAARRAIAGGGIYLNNQRVIDPDYTVDLADAVEGNIVVLRKGRKHYHVVQLLG